MNSKKRNLQALEQDLLNTSGEPCGPDRADVLTMVRDERRRRGRRGTALFTAALIVMSASLLWRPEDTPPPLVATAPPKPASSPIRELDDDQLLAFLQDTPTALVEWPNGERTLLVIGTSSSPNP